MRAGAVVSAVVSAGAPAVGVMETVSYGRIINITPMLMLAGEDYSGGGYTGGGGGGSGGFRDDTGRQGFQEYDAGDDDDTAPVRRSSSVTQSRSQPSSQAGTPKRGTTATTAPPPPKAKLPEVDLLGGFGDDEPAPAPAPATNRALPGFAAPAPAVSLDGNAFFPCLINNADWNSSRS